MKLSLMVVLILTIATISHLSMTGRPGPREAAEELPRGMQRVPPRSTMGGRNMWISIFVAVVTAAVCLGIALFVMQPAELI